METLYEARYLSSIPICGGIRIAALPMHTLWQYSRLQECSAHALAPKDLGNTLELCNEIAVDASLVQFAFELCNVSLFPEVSLHFIEYFEKNSQQSINVFFADDVSFLIDIEKNTLGRDGDGSTNFGTLESRYRHIC